MKELRREKKRTRNEGERVKRWRQEGEREMLGVNKWKELR